MHEQDLAVIYARLMTRNITEKRKLIHLRIGRYPRSGRTIIDIPIYQQIRSVNVGHDVFEHMLVIQVITAIEEKDVFSCSFLQSLVHCIIDAQIRF